MNKNLIFKNIKFSVLAYIGISVFQLLVSLCSMEEKINHFAFKNSVFYLNHQQLGYGIKESLVFLLILTGAFYLLNARRQPAAK
ncbi:hypothetical protein [Riemerella columbipharyngis]|uniref:Uncharacterized protein n=1 Tax=Riemerella columbipharyngis TaxID=1071918 RepID=A0A1G7ER98_9FLAO|nr:hypothetical protein [Riemerella columbipharyngis]SDE66228.1 hypothetical protein SAMN05421544_11711 [Riemerella columbipharyngis]